MALKKDFSNTVPDKKTAKIKIEKLTQLEETNKDTIYNLIFNESLDEAK